MFEFSQITRKNSTVPNVNGAYESVLQEMPGFVRVLEDETLLKNCIQRANEVRKDFDQLVVLGIGGSSLGAKAIVDAFDCSEKVLFFENLDSFAFDRRLSRLKKLQRIHWVAISKSGTTIETLTQLQFIDQHYKDNNLNLAAQMTVVTEMKPSPLFDFAKENNISILEIPLDVGGRFSVLTAVGLFPAVFAGLNADDFIEGAKEALLHKEQLEEFCAQMLMSFDNKEWITVFWSYSESLKTFAHWFQQLWAESLAKKVTLDSKPAPRVSSPMVMLGSNDQHSMLQQVMDGARDKFIIFLSSEREETSGSKLKNVLFPNYTFLQNKSMGLVYEAQCIGTQKALKEQGVHSATLRLTKFDEKELGAMFFFFEVAVAMLGKIHNIDTYNQPGVELSKKLTLAQLKV